jgi:hypothetical protein
MALIPITSSVNPDTGTPINSFTVAANATLEGVVLRKRMCAGAYSYNVENEALTVPNGNITTITVPNYNDDARTGGLSAAPSNATTMTLTGLSQIITNLYWYVGQKVQVFNATGNNNVPENGVITSLPTAFSAVISFTSSYTSDATTGYQLLNRPQTIRNAVLKIKSSTQAATTLHQGDGFSVFENIITLNNAYQGNDKVTTISYEYYDTIAYNLVYDVPVYVSNTKGSINLGGYDVIVWNEGILAQSFEFWVTTGTANGVVHALITDTDV